MLCRKGLHEYSGIGRCPECNRVRQKKNRDKNRDAINARRRESKARKAGYVDYAAWKADESRRAMTCPQGHAKDHPGICPTCRRATQRSYRERQEGVAPARLTVTFEQVQADVLAMRQRVRQRKIRLPR